MDAYTAAEFAYQNGYQSGLTAAQQNAWTSVRNGLPDLETTRADGNHVPKSVRVLCACKQRSGKYLVKEGYYEWWGGKAVWRIPGSIDSVTHWMPLPKPPAE